MALEKENVSTPKLDIGFTCKTGGIGIVPAGTKSLKLILPIVVIGPSSLDVKTGLNGLARQ